MHDGTNNCKWLSPPVMLEPNRVYGFAAQVKTFGHGALTIGTPDGANVEICRQVGEENMFLFGLTADEVEEKKRRGYQACEYYNNDPVLRDVLDRIAEFLVEKETITGDQFMKIYREVKGIPEPEVTVEPEMAEVPVEEAPVVSEEENEE